MEETKVIKVLLLYNQEIVVSEIEEVGAEFGDPNCKLIKPYKIEGGALHKWMQDYTCLLYTSPSPRDGLLSRMPSSA